MSSKEDMVTSDEHRDRWNELAVELGCSGDEVRDDLRAMWDEPGVDERVELVAARGGATLNEVGSVLGVSRERVRQIEGGALRKLRGRDPGVLRRLLAELNDERGDTVPRYVRVGGALRQSDALPLELHEGPAKGTTEAIAAGFARLPARLRSPERARAASAKRWGNFERG